MRAQTLRSILVASDLSPESDGVVGAAAALAADTGADLHLLHALDAAVSPLRGRVFPILKLQTLVHETRARLDEQLRRTVAPDVSTGTVKLAYEAASEAILRRAAEVDADLIVVGPHRGRGPGSRMLGTTAHRVVEASAVPCLVAREPVQSPLRRVLVPVGADDIQTRMLVTGSRWVASLRARQDGGRQPVELRALHVITAPLAWRDFSGDFAEAIRSLNDHPDVASHLHVRRMVAWSKTPAAEIARLASSGSVDLIVMGVRGHGPLLRALLGSVSAGVLHQATQPVLLVPPQASVRMAAAAGPEPDFGPAAAEVEWHPAYLREDLSDEDDVEMRPATV